MQNSTAYASVAYSIVEMQDRHRGAVVDLFNYYVRNSFAAYFEEELGEGFADAVRRTCHEHGALVAETGRGEAVGFALLRPYHSAATFRHTAEISYFILPAHTRRGLGKKLLDRLTEVAKTKDIDSLVASVSSRNLESLEFHRKCGFEECGEIRDIGIKFGESFGVVWFRKGI